ncbi:MAG: hypothetical protein LBS53_07885 [Synergistaceae bacterium]|jgi:hypothetical protein|nr:hypothetical protein [Synergistaceae bacterium]
MSEEKFSLQEVVIPVRRACIQYAMLYFHLCKTLVDSLGEKEATPLIQKIVFELSLDRSDRMRRQAQENNIECSLENLGAVNDLPRVGWSGWDKSMGGVECPYAEVWLEYFEENPWFKKLASLYCDVIDTTKIENFSRSMSHRITRNQLWGDQTCEREYFPSELVENGSFTYGTRENERAKTE